MGLFELTPGLQGLSGFCGLGCRSVWAGAADALHWNPGLWLRGAMDMFDCSKTTEVPTHELPPNPETDVIAAPSKALGTNLSLKSEVGPEP